MFGVIKKFSYNPIREFDGQIKKHGFYNHA